MAHRGAALFALACGPLVTLLGGGCGGDEPVPSDSPARESDAEVRPEASALGVDARVEDGGADERFTGPPVTCAIGGAFEVERNDTPETANAIEELMFCGVLATAKDVDYSTFETPPGMKLSLFQAIINGKVDFELSLGGSTFGPSETAKFGSGRYVVKAFTKASQPASYSYRIQFDAE